MHIDKETAAQAFTGIMALGAAIALGAYAKVRDAKIVGASAKIATYTATFKPYFTMAAGWVGKKTAKHAAKQAAEFVVRDLQSTCLLATAAILVVGVSVGALYLYNLHYREATHLPTHFKGTKAI